MVDIQKLKEKVLDNRLTIIELIHQAGVGHVGGSLSINDILTCIYETDVDLKKEKRSKVILSKGHAVPAQYANLYNANIISFEEFKTFRHLNSRLQGHPSIVDLKEVDATTGLLGQGFSLAVGVAIAKKYKNDDNLVYSIAGDAEMQEGQMWEALMSAQHYKLNNLVFIVDYNKLSSAHNVNEVINMEPFADKFKAFNCNVKVIDGHNVEEIVDSLEYAKTNKEKPLVIIAHTIKGKGVSFMENNPKWHSKGLTLEEYNIAVSEINEQKKRVCL